MPTVYGFVQSLETRVDGWVELSLRSVHAGNTTRTLFIENLDGDLARANRKIAQLGLLRDALARTLPVAVLYRSSEDQGDLIDDVTVYPSSSIEGRRGQLWVEGWVLGLAVTERSPESTALPYRDEPDTATVAMLRAGGAVESYTIDLQRPHPETGQLLVAFVSEARRTRRPIRLHLVIDEQTPTAAIGMRGAQVVVGASWTPLGTTQLARRVAFIERIGERAESYEASRLRALDHVWVKYTTAPDQSPEGDVSEDGDFVFESGTAWVHRDSPLVKRLTAALRERLQVRLGLAGDVIHEVELIAPLGSAARPIWVRFTMEPVCEPPLVACANTPTIRPPDEAALLRMRHSVAWRGSAFFAQGIWRVQVVSDGPVTLRIDGKDPCCEDLAGSAGRPVDRPIDRPVDRPIDRPIGRRADAEAPAPAPHAAGSTEAPDAGSAQRHGCLAHLYLDGMHDVELLLRDRTCRSPFLLEAHRIR